jgi:hypothetical protein
MADSKCPTSDILEEDLPPRHCLRIPGYVRIAPQSSDNHLTLVIPILQERHSGWRPKLAGEVRGPAGGTSGFFYRFHGLI